MNVRLALSLSVSCLLTGLVTSPVSAQPSVGVSIGINQPGVYGRINIGTYPEPQLVNAQPVVIVPAPVVVQRRPIYLYVPTEHQRDWRHHCARYSACNQPVYFVQENWVRERYEHEHPGWNQGRHRGWDKQDRRDHQRGDGQVRDDGRGDKQKDKHKDKHGDKRGRDHERD